MDSVTSKVGGPPLQEIERRLAAVRAALERDGLDAAIVSGSEYTGFEGAVTYLSGFVIVHRYAYVLVPLEGDPAIVFPREARYVGEHGTTWIDEQVFVDRPGEWLAERVRGQRVGVYGLDHVMSVRDYAVLAPAAESSPGTSPSTSPGPSRATTSSSRCATASASTPRASGASSTRSPRAVASAPCSRPARSTSWRRAAGG